MQYIIAILTTTRIVDIFIFGDYTGIYTMIMISTYIYICRLWSYVLSSHFVRTHNQRTYLKFVFDHNFYIISFLQYRNYFVSQIYLKWFQIFFITIVFNFVEFYFKTSLFVQLIIFIINKQMINKFL